MDTTDTTPPSMTPPVGLGELPDLPSKWPSVIGVISIVFGSLGLVCYGCNSLSTMLSPMMQNALPPEARASMPQGTFLVISIASYCVNFVLSVWLLTTGIGQLRRRPWSRASAIGWSLVKILTTVVGTVATLAFLPDIVARTNSMFQRPNATALFTITESMIVAIMVIGLVFSIAWPVFMLVWFMRQRIRDEVTAWAEEARSLI